MEGKFNTKEDAVAREVIGAAIEVHRCLGPGLLENVYEQALYHELELRRLPFQAQQQVPVAYKGRTLNASLRFDLLVAGQVLVEIKAKEALSPTDKPQLLTYLRLLDLRLGFLINFHVPILKNGIHRIVNGLPEPRKPKEIPEFWHRLSSLPLHSFLRESSFLRVFALRIFRLDYTGDHG